MNTTPTDPDSTDITLDTTPSPRSAALIAGIGYVVLFVLGIYANFIVRTGLVDPNEPSQTFANITNSELLLRTGIVSFLILFIVDVVVAWALYIVFRSVNRQVSLIAAWFRIVYTVFLGIAVIFLFLVLTLVSGAEFLNAFDQMQLEAQATLAVEAFNYTWLIGLASFGIHLIVIGYLLVVSRWAPRALGIVVAVAGAAYLIDTLAYSLMSNYADYANVFLVMVAVPSVIGEFAFTVWLFLKGGKAQNAATFSPTTEPSVPQNR